MSESLQKKLALEKLEAEAAENERKNLEFMTTWDVRQGKMTEKTVPMQMMIEKLKQDIVQLEVKTEEEILNNV